VRNINVAKGKRQAKKSMNDDDDDEYISDASILFKEVPEHKYKLPNQQTEPSLPKRATTSAHPSFDLPFPYIQHDSPSSALDFQ